jgi:hypothetical protein
MTVGCAPDSPRRSPKANLRLEPQKAYEAARLHKVGATGSDFLSGAVHPRQMKHQAFFLEIV